MKHLLKRMFIPVVTGLVLLALYLALFYEQPRAVKDIREAVPVERFTLSNGLTVVVMPNDRIPAVTHLLMVKAGAADDPYGKTGLAHYLEHLMFTGSKNYAEGVHDMAITRMGGEQNAYTTKDYTVYYATVAKQHLPEVMAMEADRLQNLLFDPVKVERELKVISEERAQRIENSAVAQMVEQLTAITFLNHPYHHPTIGWAEDMATLNGEDAKQFFNTYYRASNMVLLVAGDVTTAEVRKAAQRYYGSLPAGAAPKRNWAKEPPIRLVRNATMEDAKAREPRLVRQYIAPSVGDGVTAQALPLALLAQYMGGGESSLFYRRLVREEKLASTVDVSYDPFAIGPELFRIAAVPAPGVTLAKLEAGIDAALADVQSTPPDEAAFLRAKTQLKAEVIFAQDGLSSLAKLIVSLYALGLDEQYFYDWPENIEKVTAEQMRGAAGAVLAPGRRVTGYLTPPVAPAAPTAPTTPATEAPHAP